MTSVFPEGLVETVAKARWEMHGSYEKLPPVAREREREEARRYLRLIAPCVAGLIADRLDEAPQSRDYASNYAQDIRIEFGVDAK